MHCNGPHPVTAPCCPLYKEKMEENMPKLLRELLSNVHTPQNVPNRNDDALHLLTTAALTANGSIITFINTLFTASLESVQPNNLVIPYTPYSLPLTFNSDWEASSICLSRSTSSLVSAPGNETHEHGR